MGTMIATGETRDDCADPVSSSAAASFSMVSGIVIVVVGSAVTVGRGAQVHVG